LIEDEKDKINVIDCKTTEVAPEEVSFEDTAPIQLQPALKKLAQIIEAEKCETLSQFFSQAEVHQTRVFQPWELAHLFKKSHAAVQAISKENLSQ